MIAKFMEVAKYSILNNRAREGRGVIWCTIEKSTQTPLIECTKFNHFSQNTVLLSYRTMISSLCSRNVNSDDNSVAVVVALT